MLTTKDVNLSPRNALGSWLSSYRRPKIVFKDIMALFAQDEVLDEYPLRIKFAGEWAMIVVVYAETYSLHIGMKLTSNFLMEAHC